jgi:hypothetical protein
MADDLGLVAQPEIIGLCRLSARRMGWQQESQQRRVARRESRQPSISVSAGAASIRWFWGLES